MIEVNVTREKIDAFKENLKIGAKVNYRTPVYSSEENPGKSKNDNEAHVIQKLKNVAIVEYNAKRGKGTAVTTAAMPYKELYMQHIGIQY